MPIDWGLLELGLEVVTRSWDAVKNREALYNTERFVRAHQENLEKSIDNIRDISKHPPDVLKDGAREVLRMMSAVVKANIRDQDVEVNANYMIPRTPSDELMASALFCDSKRRSSSYACFLELQAWAHDVPDPTATCCLAGRLDVHGDAFRRSEDLLKWQSRDRPEHSPHPQDHRQETSSLASEY